MKERNETEAKVRRPVTWTWQTELGPLPPSTVTPLASQFATLQSFCPKTATETELSSSDSDNDKENEKGHQVVARLI